MQAQAAELFRRARPVDANVLAAVVPILAHAGDAARYDDFEQRFRTAQTPQEEQRYLLALAGFRGRRWSSGRWRATLNGDVRTQDAPFVLRGLLMSVHGRERPGRSLQDELGRDRIATLPPTGCGACARG